jgi:nickel transport system ATP-binding protein
MSELLQVESLCIGLKQTGKPIVKQVSFALRKGAALAVVGESGSGKTLTCKAIMRLLHDRTFTVSGSIRYRGQELLAASERDMRALRGNRIAMIVQHPMMAFDPTATIGTQITETIMARRRISKRDAYSSGVRALERMNLPRCEQLMNSYPSELSGGMLQRIVIALAIIHEPDVIIADEPTTALDVRNQSMVLQELKQLKQSGIGLLLVTHDFGVAAGLADEMLVMREGEVIERGTVHDVFAAPREAYTKELLEARILMRKEDRHDRDEGCIQTV